MPVGATESDEVRGITKQTGRYTMPSVSADGATVAFLGYDDPSSDPQNVRLGVVPVDGGDHAWLTLDLDRTFLTTAGTMRPRWIDATTILGTAEDRGETHLFRATTSAAAPERLTSGPITVKAFDARGGTIALTVSAVDEVADVFVLDAGGDLRRLTDFAERYRELVEPLTWERFVVPTTDGTAEIDAWIMRPAGFDPTATYPAILNVHGGPHTQYGETYFDEAQFQAAAGFVVLMSNPRGGSGREESWGQSIMGPKHPRHPGTGWGSVDVEDVLAVVDHAVAKYPFVDAGAPRHAGRQLRRLHGDVAGRHDRHEVQGDLLRAGRQQHVHRGVHERHRHDLPGRARPRAHRRPAGARAHVADPLRRDIEVPILILHSEEDWRCPISQAEELFTALRLLDKDVTFYRFPGENHELSRSGSPVHRCQRAEIVLDFFAQHLA